MSAPEPFPMRRSTDVLAASALRSADSRGNYLVIGSTVVAAIAALYFGRHILIPVTLAALLAFTLQPLSTGLRRYGLGRVPSVLLVVTLALALLGSFGVLIGSQVVRMAESLPVYKSNVQQKLHDLQLQIGGRTFDQATKALRDLNREIDSGGKPGVASAPVQVQVVEPAATPLQVAQGLLGSMLAPATVFALAIVFLVFILLEQEDLRDRVIRLFGDRDMSTTTQAISDASQRVGRYLLMQLLVNAMYGIPIGIGLYFIGVPNALLWGASAIVLRFIPYFGPVIAALFPIGLAFAADPGWTMVWQTIALFIVVDLLTNQILGRRLFGTSTGMSPVAMIAAAIFWTTLWGPVGLLLSTPLTACLIVLGRYVPQLHFLYVLLGNAPALTPPERLYQRMLADDALEGSEIAARFCAELGADAFCEEVALPALHLAEADRRRDRLSPARIEGIAEVAQKVFAQLEDLRHAGPPARAPVDLEEAPPVPWRGATVLCIGARTPLDTAAAALLAQALHLHGAHARVAPVDYLEGDAVKELARRPSDLVVLVHLNDFAGPAAQRGLRRLHQYGDAPVLIAALDQRAPRAGTMPAIGPRPVSTVFSIDQAIQWISARARIPLPDPMVEAA